MSYSQCSNIPVNIVTYTTIRSTWQCEISVMVSRYFAICEAKLRQVAAVSAPHDRKLRSVLAHKEDADDQASWWNATVRRRSIWP